MNGWVDFKRSFTQDQEDALWQYFIDHSQVQPNGYLGVQFYVRDVNDFFRRVYARYCGDFKRYDQQDKETKQLKYETLMDELRRFRRIARRNSDIAFRIGQEGTITERLILGLYRWSRGYLFDRKQYGNGDATA